MLEKRLCLFICIVFSFCFISSLNAETIKLTSGEVLEGQVTSYTTDSITFLQSGEADERVIPRSEIISIYLQDAPAISDSKPKSIQDTKVDEESMKDQDKTKNTNLDQEKNEFPLMRIYLKNGEKLQGYITKATKENITLTESASHNFLQVPLKRIILVTSNMATPYLGDRSGIGLITSRSSLLAQKINISDAVDQISYRIYSQASYFNEFLLGFTNTTSTTVEKKQTVNVTSFKYRFAKVLKKQERSLLYIGVGAGYLYVEDQTQVIPVKESGIEFSGFTGVEFFFPSFPNLSFSTEIGASYKALTHYHSLQFSAGPFPSFSMHYYF